MNRVTMTIALACVLVASPARAELREIKQTIYGMD